MAACWQHVLCWQPTCLYLAAREAPAQEQAEEIEGGADVVRQRWHQQDVLSALQGAHSSVGVQG